jgi:hypothetical protein
MAPLTDGPRAIALQSDNSRLCCATATSGLPTHAIFFFRVAHVRRGVGNLFRPPPNTATASWLPVSGRIFTSLSLAGRVELPYHMTGGHVHVRSLVSGDLICFCGLPTVLSLRHCGLRRHPAREIRALTTRLLGFRAPRLVSVFVPRSSRQVDGSVGLVSRLGVRLSPAKTLLTRLYQRHRRPGATGYSPMQAVHTSDAPRLRRTERRHNLGLAAVSNPLCQGPGASCWLCHFVPSPAVLTSRSWHDDAPSMVSTQSLVLS